MDFRVFSRNISENMHARCVREDTKQALKGNLQADSVQSRQTLFVRYCLKTQKKAAGTRFENGYPLFYSKMKKVQATPHKARLAALYAICLLIFRHTAQKSLDIRQYACGIFVQSVEKSDYASYAQALCGVA